MQSTFHIEIGEGLRQKKLEMEISAPKTYDLRCYYVLQEQKHHKKRLKSKQMM